MFTLLLAAGAISAAPPAHVASLNLCTDSLLFELLPDARIASVTRLSRDPNLSPFHARAARLMVNRGDIEEVVAAAPDLVVTSGMLGVLAGRLLARLDIPVLSLPHANEFTTYRANLRELAARLGRKDVAEAHLAQLTRSLAAAAARAARRPRRSAVLYQPNGYTPGRDSLMQVIMDSAGLDSIAHEHGDANGDFMDLERLLVLDPQVLVFSTRDTRRPSLAERQLEHPALRAWRAKATGRSRQVPEAWWTCAGAYNARAIDALGAGP